jgi:hypothetical protein
MKPNQGCYICGEPSTAPRSRVSGDWLCHRKDCLEEALKRKAKEPKEPKE